MKNISKKNTNFLYTDLMSVEDYSDLSPKAILSHLSQLIDVSLDLGKIEGINKALDFIDSVDINRMSSVQKAYFYYYTANAWCNKNAIEHPVVTDKNRWERDLKDYEEAIYYLRSSIKEVGFIKLSSDVKCHIYTNLGNAFDIVGRFIGAIEYWEKSLEIDPGFGMALGNIGLGLYYYAYLLYDSGHQVLFIREARKKLEFSIKALSGVEQYNFALDSFKGTLAQIEELLGKSKDHTCLTIPYSLGRSRKEKQYRMWCLRNRLFLNPLNDLGDYDIAARDIITTPGLVTAINVGPRYQGFYNQIKQEFVSARYLYYEGINLKPPHFSDRDVLQFNTLDYPCYSISIEKIKIAFRVAYSLLDKIAYFINEYFALGKKSKYVYFKTIWFNKEKEFHPILKSNRNKPLRGLYWLSKDFFDKGTGYYIGSVEPDAEDFYTIRNHLEHKYFKVHDMLIKRSADSTSLGLEDDLAFSIERHDFESKTLRILRLVRNALIYLSLSIHAEEKERSKKRDPNEVLVPIISSLWEDDWKI